MSTRETSAILTAREEILTSLEKDHEELEDFSFTGKIHFIGNRVWHEILIEEPKILIYAFVDNFKEAHVAVGLNDAAHFDFS